MPENNGFLTLHLCHLSLIKKEDIEPGLTQWSCASARLGQEKGDDDQQDNWQWSSATAAKPNRWVKLNERRWKRKEGKRAKNFDCYELLFIFDDY